MEIKLVGYYNKKIVYNKQYKRINYFYDSLRGFRFHEYELYVNFEKNKNYKIHEIIKNLNVCFGAN